MSDKLLQLIQAAAYHRPEITELIASGKGLDGRDQENRSVLHVAADYLCAGIVRELLATGKFKVDDRDAAGRTALHFAIGLGERKRFFFVERIRNLNED